jgi:hypothetical protein
MRIIVEHILERHLLFHGGRRFSKPPLVGSDIVLYRAHQLVPPLVGVVRAISFCIDIGDYLVHQFVVDDAFLLIYDK